MGRRNPLTDWVQFLLGERYPWRNQARQIWWRSLKGFRGSCGSNFSIYNTTLSHYCVSVWLWRRYSIPRQWRSQDLEVGAQRVWGMEVPQRVSRGRAPGGFGGRSSPKAHSVLRIFGCQTMHNSEYLAKLHEPLVKHEIDLGYAACLFAALLSNWNTGVWNT